MTNSLLKKSISTLLLAICFSFVAQAQFSVKGKLEDKYGGKNVENAVVALLQMPDSILTKFTRSKADGSYEIKNAKPGNYVILITHPLFGEYQDDLVITGSKEIDIALISKSTLLSEVIVSTGSPIKIKGDTINYTADSFKVAANSNVEALLKKLPGITVDKNGKITAMGETVQKVLVDGEEFFGDDPGMVTKNLRADAVKEVQVFDKKSDQAEFTGIDDGKKQKTINLKLKDNAKKGYFGRLELAGGLDKWYNNKLFFNDFKGKRKVSLFGLMGSVGEDGLNYNDGQNYGGEQGFQMGSSDDEGGAMGMMFSVNSGGGDEDVDQMNMGGNQNVNGFPVNWNTGMHYGNKWGSKFPTTLNGSYKFSKVNRNTGYNQSSINFTPTGTFTDKTVQNQFSQRFRNNGNFSIESKLDSANTLKYNVRGSASSSNSIENINNERINNLLISKNPSVRNRNSERLNLLNTLNWKHKFKKARRTLSVNTEFGLTNTESESLNNGVNELFVSNVKLRSDSINQRTEVDNVSNRFETKATYTEPLTKVWSLETNYTISTSKSDNDRSLNARDFNGKYSINLPGLSNQTLQKSLRNKLGVNFRFNKKKINYSFGAAYGIANLDLDDLTRNQQYNYKFKNFFPRANLNLQLKKNRSFSLTYNTNAIFPTLNQFQRVYDSTNLFNHTIGNPNLKQSFTHNITSNYFGYNFTTQKFFYGFGSYTSEINDIASTQDSITGKPNVLLNSYTNVNGNKNAMINGGIGFRMKGKKSKITTQIMIGWTSNLNINNNFIYGKRNTNTTFTNGPNFRIGIDKEKKFDYSFSGTVTYNNSKGSLQQNNAVKYWLFTNNSSFNWTLKKGLRFGTDVDINLRQKTRVFANNNNNYIWDAYIFKDILKEKFTLKFNIFDILNQNNGFTRNASANGVYENVSQRIQRYWLMGVTWNFNKNGKPANMNGGF